MSIPVRRTDTLKKRIYTPDEAKTIILKKKQVDIDIVSGESGEDFAVFFYPTSGVKNMNLKTLVANVAQLLDLDKPYGNISSIRVEKHKNKTAVRIGWSA